MISVVKVSDLSWQVPISLMCNPALSHIGLDLDLSRYASVHFIVVSIVLIYMPCLSPLC